MKNKKAKEKDTDGVSGFLKRFERLKRFILLTVFANLLAIVSTQSCNAGTYLHTTGAAYCTPCPVGSRCSSDVKTACTGNKYSFSRSSSCSTLTSGMGRVKNGVVYTCPENKYQSSVGTCSACPTRETCDGSATHTACSTITSNVQLSNDGSSCYDCPSGHTCSTSNVAISQVTPAAAGKYLTTSNSFSDCAAGEYCINGIKNNCDPGTWSLANYTSCHYCPPNHICNQTPTSCSNGQYLATLTSTSCTTCEVGYFCIKDLTYKIKASVGMYAPANSASPTVCPAGASCTSSAATACGTDFTFSGIGETNCISSPTFLRFSSSSSRTPTGTLQFGLGYKRVSGDDDNRTGCGSANYCPGDGDTYTAYEGLTFTTGTITANAPGDGCSNGEYSNGGTDCFNCTAAASDRSQCVKADGTSYFKVEFSKSYYNGADEREGVVVNCLPHASFGGTDGTTSGTDGRVCGIEGSFAVTDPDTEVEVYNDDECASDANSHTRHSTSSYLQCTWCPEDLNCNYHHSFFTFFRGYLLECGFGEYSASGVMDCERKNWEDNWCKDGYYMTVHSTDYADDWIHEQDARYECIPINQSPSTDYQAVDSTYEPDCEVGDLLRYGIEGCRANSPGFYNDANQYEDATLCEKGYICQPDMIDGKWKTAQVSCPKGSMGLTAGASSELLQCDLCEAGKYCDEGTSSDNVVDCPKGYVCPAGTNGERQNACPAGLFNPSTGGISLANDCAMCPVTFYCETAAENNTQACDGGYFCWKYTKDKYETPILPGKYSAASTGTYTGAFEAALECPAGQYCPIHTATPLDCPSGTYTPSAGAGEIMNCGECPAGKACPDAGTTSTGSMIDCPKAHYCPEGTTDPFTYPCPVGTYSDNTGNTAASDCTDCPTGKACKERTATTAETITVSSGSQAVNGIENCAAGHYCPLRTELPDQYPCPAGTFTTATNLAAASECTDCTAGSWCDEGSADDSVQCPKNFYCELGATSPEPCAAGEFSAAGASSCSPCTAGHICPEYHENDNPIACPAGYYKDGTGSAGPCDPAPEGYYSTGTGAKIACVDGKWSAPGGRNDSVCVDCPVGYYCVSGTKTECGAGKWCPAGSSSATDCTEGYFCPDAATTVLLVCPAGTYSAAGASACSLAPGGYYTDQGTTDAQKLDNQCDQGFYCPDGSYGPKDETCDLNKYTQSGDVASASTDCSACPAGKYCLRGVVDPVDCPAGYYCPANEDYPVACPKGTFRADPGAEHVDNCTACTLGKVCSQTALIAPDKDCDAGYYCPAGSAFSRTVEPACTEIGCDVSSSKVLPTGVTRAIECPVGHYCEEGSGTPTECAAGTYNAVQGQRTVAACLNCPAGTYCTGGLKEPNGNCTEGYYCEEGSDSPTKVAAPAGSFSLNGSASATLCYPGTFQATSGQSSCDDCTEGYHCPGFGNDSETECPAGSYCPAKSNKPIPCPAGTFSATAGLTHEDNCTACTAGSYCHTHGLTAVTGNCSAGYFCRAYAISSMPSNDYSNFNFGPCPKGYYCPEETGDPNPCVAGKYLDVLGADNSDDCKDCLPGKYCAGTGNHSPDGDCDAGYYCPGGDDTATPATACAAGEYCPVGSSLNTKCPAGYYSATAQASSCTICPAGKYCPLGTSDITGTNNDCPTGYYCPEGTKRQNQYPCPSGKFSGATGNTDIANCTACTAGYACENPGVSDPTSAPCTEGFYCLEGSSFTVPQSTTYGGMCSPGTYCQAGSATPTACDGGKYCETYMLSGPSGTCAEGYYCTTVGSKYQIIPADFASTGGALCGIGKYCIEGASVEADCPIGTYSASTGLAAEADCYACPAGYYCQDLAQTNGTLYECPAGYFCPFRTSDPNANECPKGYKCPLGSAEAIICDGGTFQNETGQPDCNECEKGYYCPFDATTGLIDQITCPAGYKCADTGMTAPAACLAGEYQENTGQEECDPCPAGSYCDRQGLSAVSGLCPAGFYCPANQINKHEFMCSAGTYCEEGSSEETSCETGKYCDRSALGTAPNDCLAGYYCDELETTDGSPTSKECPRGKYCEAGTTTPTDCAVGTYNSKLGADSDTYCLDCPDGKLCDELGLVEPKSTCPATQYCVGNVTYDCEAGYFCPAGYDYKLKCQPGTYQDTTAQSSCKECTAGYYCYFDSGTGLITSQTACPQGYYCPARTSHYHRYPCPAGQYGTATLLDELGDCTDCQVNKYCDRRGLSAVSGDCKDGYLCDAGSIYPTGLSDNECPQGNYCIAGIQTACGDGEFNSVTGSSTADDCLPCDIGKYCPNKIGTKVDCTQGYVCGEGLMNMAGATDCQTGHYCPSGTSTAVKCKPGTFQDTVRQTSCKACTAGHICDGIALTSETACPDFRECPASSIRGRRCDPGEYIASGSNTCVDCLAGKYCWPLPKATGDDDGDQGTCSNGYVCKGGSSYQKPLISLTSTTASSTYNGPAFPGYKSTDGQTNVACDIGKWQPSAFATDCLDCREGHYCNQTAISDLSNFKCSSGQTCGSGLSSDSGTICPAGKYCEEGSLIAQHCDDGYQSATTGLSACTECGDDQFCYQSGTAPSLSETITACATNNTNCLNTGTLKREPKCQDGTYLTGGVCTLCPDTNYCRGGTIAGNCIAGFKCVNDGASLISDPDPSNLVCPVNYYCDEGTTTGTMCEEGTFNGNTGGISDQQCLPCEPGYQCKTVSGVTQVIACPIGFWCPEYDIDTNTQEDPQPCPIYTSSSVTKIFMEEMCIYCPAGYDCNAENITEYTQYPCPIGYYCIPNGLNGNTNGEYVSKHLCPDGSYGNRTGLTAYDLCSSCPEGYYCNQTISSTTPQACSGGAYCPEGSELEVTCRGGYYCNAGNEFQETICPVNYKCEPATEDPVECAAGVICPEGSLRGTKCGRGYEVQTIDGADTCKACSRGEYNTDAAQDCQPCTAGYLCYGEPSGVTDDSVGGTNSATPLDKDTEYGEICPAGYYCPEGSYKATACPTGKYNPDTGKASEDDCVVCPVNTYNDLEGQTGCQPCGEFAYSQSGAETCTCYGDFRIFGKSDSSCRCLPRYVYRKITGEIERNNVSKEDCLALTYDRCDSSSQVRNLNGDCVDIDGTYCNSQCDSGSGYVDIELGTCTCSDTPPTAESTCNDACIAASSDVTYDPDSEELIYTSSGVSVTIDLSSDSNAIGEVTCENEQGCSVTQTSNDNGVFQGSYGTTDYIQKASVRLRRLNQSSEDQSTWEFAPSRRGLSVVNADEYTIDNPVICIENGDSVQWQIDDYNHYPEYDENNILNTNDEFDYGPFVDLSDQITAKDLQGKTGTSDPILFSYSFTDGGTYVFFDHTTTDNQMVIVVADEGETCSDSGSNIQSSSSRSLSSAGASQSDDIVLALDTALLGSIIGFLVVIVCIIAVSVAYCLQKAFDLHRPGEARYREHQKANDLKFELLGEEDSAEVVNQDSVHCWPVENEDDMENVDFNIHADIINHSNEFLNIYNEAMLTSEERKRQERKIMNDLISEINAMIELCGESAIDTKMYYGPAKDIQDVEKDLLNDQDSQDKSPLDKTPGGRSTDDDSDEARLHQDVLRREDELRALLIRDDAQAQEEKLKKEIMAEMGYQDQFDEEEKNQGLSLHDQIKQRIAQDGNFDEQEKDKMMFDYDKKLEGVESELEKERNRQQNALSQQLKGRAEMRRRKLDLKENDKLKKDELDKIQKDFEQRMKDQLEKIDKDTDEHEIKLKRAATKEAKDFEKDAIKDLRDKKRAVMEQLEKERVTAAQEAMDRLEKADEMDEDETKALINKFIPREKLDEIDEDFRNQKENIDQQKEFELEDLKRRQQEEIDALRRQLESNSGQDDDAIDLFINTLSQRIIDQHQDADEKDKEEHFKRINNLRDMLKDVDNKLDKDALIKEFENKHDYGDVLQRDRDTQNQNIQARLAARNKDKKKKMMEALRIAHEEEEAKLVLDQLGREHLRKGEINKDQIKKIVKLLLKKMDEARKDGEEIPELTMNKIRQLFESMFGEVEMTDFTNQLVKHFAEKEIMLKRLLARYMDMKRLEQASIKKHYGKKIQDLDNNQDLMDPYDYDSKRKDLILRQEIALRDLDANLDNLHKEEEAALLKTLEKRHARESIQLKNDLLEEKIKAYNELFRNQGRKGHDDEIRIYKKALLQYKDKKEKELERRLRAIEFAKQKVENKVRDYEDLLRRKREEEQWIKDRKNQIKEALIRHKELIKQKLGNHGEDDKDKIFQELEKGYKALSGSIEKERKRMFLQMQQRDQKRRQMMENYNNRNVIEFGGLGDKVKIMDNTNTYVGKLLHGWRVKNEERIKLVKKMEETAKREYMYLKQPGALINELLRRVKNLENLLRYFDSERIYKLMMKAGDQGVKARIKH